MSSNPLKSPPLGRAEQAFRDAFERLKSAKPILVPRGTRVSQNNVAKEAGVDPSALKKSRFPGLIEEIQRWVADLDEKPTSPNQQSLRQRKRNRSLKEQLEAFKQQRDIALSLLADADARILELTIENARLSAQIPRANITELSRSKPK